MKKLNKKNISFVEGNLVADAKIFESSKSEWNKAAFKVAVGVPGVTDESDHKADYIPCFMFLKKGSKLSDYLKKGQGVSIIGSIFTDSHFSQKSGEKIYTTDVKVSQLDLVWRKKKDDGSTEDVVETAEEGTDFMDLDDDAARTAASLFV